MTVWLPICFVGSLVILAAAVLLLRDLWWERRHRIAPEEAERLQAEYRRRLHAPRWEELEALFRAPAPAALKSLYSDAALVARADIHIPNPTAEDPDNEEWIGQFVPADVNSVEEASWVIPEGECPFAADGMGNYYTIRFSADASRPVPVRFHMHDGGESWEVSPDLEEFLRQLRNAIRGGPR